MPQTVISATGRNRLTSSRRRLARDDRREQLLATADAVFAAHGVQGTSMDDIAARAGVTKPVVYDHFGSKDGLVAALVHRAGLELAESVVAAVESSDDPATALERGVRSYFRFMADRRDTWATLLTESSASSAAAAAIEQVRDQQAELIASLIRDDVPDCDLASARLYAQVVVGACERLATRPTHGRRPASPDRLTRHVMDVIWCGFGAVRAGQRWHDR